MNSKVILTVLGLAALVATPALAAKKAAHHATSEAAASDAAMMRPVVSNGYTLGTDPDANVRFELERDAPTYSVGN